MKFLEIIISNHKHKISLINKEFVEIISQTKFAIFLKDR